MYKIMLLFQGVLPLGSVKQECGG